MADIDTQTADNDENKPARRPLTPLDFALARFEKWIEEREAVRANEKQETAIADDIPRFVTRYS